MRLLSIFCSIQPYRLRANNSQSIEINKFNDDIFSFNGDIDYIRIIIYTYVQNLFINR